MISLKFLSLIAVAKMEYLMITEGYSFSFYIETICYDFSSEPSGREETVQISGNKIHFKAALTKIIPNYHQILLFGSPGQSPG